MDINENFPLCYTIINNNIDMTQLLIDYANKNNIILNIYKEKNNKDFPFLIATSNNDVGMVKLLINYANKNNIILNINNKNISNFYIMPYIIITLKWLNC